MTTAFHTNARFAEHTIDGHPEYAERQQAIIERLHEYRLVERFTSIEGREATLDELRGIHTDAHLDLLEDIARSGRAVMVGYDTYVLPVSYEIARLAAGGLLNVVDAVIGGEADNGLAVIRPPGHHASPSQVMGFCLLNNIAIAARHAANRLGHVAIVDFDVHHGNGTQDAFYDDPDVLFISSHQSPLYPGTGPMQQTGRGAARGTTINIPVPPGTGDSSFQRLYTEIVLPALKRFEPAMMLVSAGFDAHWRDPLANLELSLSALAQLSTMLKSAADDLCDGQIIFVTEGGYDLEVLSFGVVNLAHILLEDDTRHDPVGKTERDVPITDLVVKLRTLHQIP